MKRVVSIASTYVFDGVFGKINNKFRMLLGRAEAKAYQIQERMLERTFSFLTLVLACLFIVLGVYSFLLEYLRFTNTEAYILVGVALLAAYYLMNQKQRFGKEIEED